MEHGQPNWLKDVRDDENENLTPNALATPSNTSNLEPPLVSRGRHGDPFQSLEYESGQAESPAEAIPGMPEGAYRIGVELEDSLTAQTLADIEALEAAQSILDPDVLQDREPIKTSERHSDEWFGGLTEVDNPLDEPRPVERVNPFRRIPGRPAIESYLTWVVQNEGSDLHISAGEAPWVRIYGDLRSVKNVPVLTNDDMTLLVAEVLSNKEATIFSETQDIDTAYSMSEMDGAPITSRFRVNVFVTMERIGMVIRVIPTQIKTLDELKLLPVVKQLAKLPRGLVLVTGPTGSGKSTTMAAIVDLINTTREERIFTFEDPVEFTHTSKRSLISHREIGTDTASFPSGLKAVLREDPDIILIGEMRDNATIRAAIESADAGHYVLATLHTSSAYETVGRIINTFPEEEQNQVRVTLASILRAVVCQTLVPSTQAYMGRVVASEIMIVTPGIQNNIRENDLPAIRNALSDTTHGSISLDAHLAQLIGEGKITKREALKKATSAQSLERQLGSGVEGKLV